MTNSWYVCLQYQVVMGSDTVTTCAPPPTPQTSHPFVHTKSNKVRGHILPSTGYYPTIYKYQWHHLVCPVHCHVDNGKVLKEHVRPLWLWQAFFTSGQPLQFPTCEFVDLDLSWCVCIKWTHAEISNSLPNNGSSHPVATPSKQLWNPRGQCQ